MMLRLLTTVAALVSILVAAALGGASASQAAAKPGFLPGTWKGTGTISGSSSDGVMSTRHSGQIRFTLIVRNDLSASGSGTWKVTMKGSGPESSSTMTGTAALKLSGAAREVRFAGQERVTGFVTASGVKVPIRMAPRTLKGRLLIGRPGKCSASGTAPMGPGVSLKWTARLVINGTCNA
jgi:hypothetical protein